jgi:hypothetical protein
MTKTCRSALVLVLAAGLAAVTAAREDEVPRELGRVRWERDLDLALAQPAAAGRPLFVLFQEVPGCSTCVGFGEQALSHPLLVEAIESEFTPVLVLNDQPGKDAELLARFGEPAWNNPVVRFLDGAGRDLIPRRAGVWTRHGIAERMVLALEAAGRDVPGYLHDVVEELASHGEERATLAMSCYWSGEACIGGIPGVLATRTGSLDGREVVEALFDPGRIPYRRLLVEVVRRRCADFAFAHTPAQLESARERFGPAVALEPGAARAASDRDQKYHLRRSRLRAAELTPRQATRLNAALAAGLDPAPLLSPRQRKLLDGI